MDMTSLAAHVACALGVLLAAVSVTGCGHAPQPIGPVGVTQGLCPSAPPALPYTDDPVSGQTPEDVAELLRAGKHLEVQNLLKSTDSGAVWAAFVRGDVRWASGDRVGAAQAYREALALAGPGAWVAGVRLVLALDESSAHRAKIQRRIAATLMGISTHPGCIVPEGALEPEGVAADDPQAELALLGDVLELTWTQASQEALDRAFVLDAAAPHTTVNGRRVPLVVREGVFVWPNAARRHEVLLGTWVATMLGQALETEGLSEGALWMLADFSANMRVEGEGVLLQLDAGALSQDLTLKSPLGQMLEVADEVLNHRAGVPGVTLDDVMASWSWMEAQNKRGEWFLALAPQGVFAPNTAFVDVGDVVQARRQSGRQSDPVLVVGTLERSGACGAPEGLKSSIDITTVFSRSWPPNGLFDHHADAQDVEHAEAEIEACIESGFVHPKNWFYPYMAGRLSIFIGDFERAEVFLSRARQLAAPIVAQRAVDLVRIEVSGRAKDYSAVRKRFEAAVENDPDGYGWYFSLYANAMKGQIPPAEFVLACRDAAQAVPELAASYRLSAGKTAVEANLPGALEDLRYVLQRGDQSDAFDALNVLGMWSESTGHDAELSGALVLFANRFGVSDAETRSMLASGLRWSASSVAEALCDDVLGLDSKVPERVAALKRCAAVFMGAEAYEKAIAAHRSLLNEPLKDDDKAQVRVELGDALMKEARYEDVVALWKAQASSKEPKLRAEALMYTSKARLEQGNIKEALLLARRAVKASPSRSSWTALGDVLVRSGEDAQALRAFEEAILAAKDRFDAEQSMSGWGELCKRSGLWAQCVQRTLAPTFATPELRCQMSNKLLMKAWSIGLKAMSEPLLEPQRLCASPYGLDVGTEIEVLLALGRVDEAAALAEAAVVLPPSLSDLFDALYQRGERQRADALFARYVKEGTEWQDRPANLFRHLERYGQFERAKGLAAAILEDKPLSGQYITMLTRLQVELGEAPSALALFERLERGAKDKAQRLFFLDAKAKFLRDWGYSVSAIVVYKEMMAVSSAAEFEPYANNAYFAALDSGDIDTGRQLCRLVNKRLGDALVCEVKLLTSAGRWEDAWALFKDLDSAQKRHGAFGRLFSEVAAGLGYKDAAVRWSEAYLRHDPGSFAGPTHHISVLVWANQYDDASKAIDVFLKERPRDAVGVFGTEMVTLMGAVGRGDEAKRLQEAHDAAEASKDFWKNPKLTEREIKARMKRDALMPKSWSELGAFRMRQGRFGEAVKAYRKALSMLTHDRLPMREKLAIALWRDGKLDEGVKVLREELAAGESVTRTYQRLGWLFIRAGECKEAVAAFDAQRVVLPGSLFGHSLRAHLMIHDNGGLGGLEEFERHLPSMESLYRSAFVYGALVELAGFSGSMAIEPYKKALAERPHEAPLLKGLSNALADAGQTQEALKHARLFWQIERTSEASVFLFERFLAAGLNDEAQDLASHALMAHGGMPGKEMVELELALRTGNTQESLLQLKKNVAMSGWLLWARVALAKAAGLDKFAAALAQRMEASAGDNARGLPCSPDVQLKWARVLAAQGAAQRAESEKIVQQWTSGSPNPRVLLLAAEVYLTLGRHSDALNALARAQKLRGTPWRELDVLKIEVLAAKGDKEGARALLKEAQSRIQGHWRMAVINARLEP